MKGAILKLGALAIIIGPTACASPEEIRAADEAACSTDGFQAGTQDFAACLQRQSVARQYVPPPTARYGSGWYGSGWYGSGWYGPGWYGSGWYRW
jgi:hypothetical protein